MKINTLIKDGDLRKEILFYLLAGGIVMSVLSQPYLLAPAILIVKYQRKGYSKRKIQNTFYYMKNSGFVDVRSRRGKIHYSLTDKGIQKAFQYKISTSLMKRPKHWDGKWRLVLFDVLSAHRYKRDSLRNYLSKIGSTR